MKLSPVLSALAGFALVQASLPAQQNSIDFTEYPDALNRTDRDFLQATAQGLRFEVAAGKLAQTRAAGSAVKQFGLYMVRDHSADYTALAALAQEEAVPLPPGLSSDQSAEYEKLKSLSGAAFDQEYIGFEIQDHHLDIQDYTEEVRNGEDFEVQRYAADGVTELLEHLAMAQSIGKALGVNGP